MFLLCVSIQVSLLGGADESVKMSTSPTLTLDTRSAMHSTPVPEMMTTTTSTKTTTTMTPPEPTDVAAVEMMVADADWNGPDDPEIVAAVAGEEDVTAELSAPVAVAAGFGHAEWQMLAAGGAGMAAVLLMALVLAFRRTGGGSPGLHKVVRHDDAECPPLLDYPPRPLDFTKYLGKCFSCHPVFVHLEEGYS